MTLLTRPRWPRGVGSITALLLTPILLGGCPQLLKDDFRVSDEAHGSGTGGSGTSTTDGDPSSGSTSEVLNGGGGDTASMSGAGTNAGGSVLSATVGNTAVGGTSNSEIPVAGSLTGGTSTGPTTGGAVSTGGTSTGTLALRSCDARATPPRTTYGSRMVADFNEWNQVTPLSTWLFTFKVGTNVLANGLVASFEDGAGRYELGLVTERIGDWAARAHNYQASDWGAGIALMIDCVDTSVYTGLSFRIRGHASTGKADVMLRLPSSESVRQTFQIATDWRSYQLPFSGFSGSTASPSARTNGDGIDKIVFSPQLTWTNHVAQPGILEVVIDDDGFY